MEPSSITSTMTSASSALVSGVGDAVTGTVSMITSLLPLGLTIFAVTWAVRKAIRFFKGTAN